MSSPLQRTAFNGGIVAPELRWRPDLARFQNSCRDMKNALVTPFGSARKRPGTKHVAYFFNRPFHRFLPFEPGGEKDYLVVLDWREEIGEEPWGGEGEQQEGVYLTVFRKGVGVVEFLTEYPRESLDLIQYVQSFDVMFLTHPDVPLMRLERRSGGWDFVPHEFRGGPFQEYTPITESSIASHFDVWTPGIYEAGDTVAQFMRPNASGNTAQYLVGADVAPTIEDHDDFGFDDRVVQWAERTVIRRRYYRAVKFRFHHATDTDVSVAWVDVGGPVAGELLRIREGNFDGAWRVIQIYDPSGDPRDPTTAVRGTGTTGFNAATDFTDVLCESPYWWKEELLDPETLEVIEDDVVDPDDQLESGTLNGAFGIKLTQTFADVDAPSTSRWTLYRATDPRTAANTNAPSDDTSNWQRTSVYDGGDVFVDSPDEPVTEGDMSLLRQGPFRGRVGGLMRFRTQAARVRSGIFRFFSTAPRIRLLEDTEDPATDGNYVDSQVSRAYQVYGTVLLRTEGGTWRGDLTLEASNDDGETWEPVRVIASNGDRNAEVEFVADQSNTLIRLHMTRMTNVTDATVTNRNQCRWTLEFQTQAATFDVIEGRGGGHIGRLTPGQFLQGAFPAELKQWSFGAFSERDGFPSCIAIHEERMILSGVRARPGTLYGSAINDWEEWAPGDIETSPITLTLASSGLAEAQWLVSRQELLIGLDGSEWSLGSRTFERVLYGENLQARQQSTIGSAPIQAVQSKSFLLFATRGGKRLIAMQYSFANDQYDPIDLSEFAPQLTASGIRSIALTQVPWDVFWIVTNDGQLLSLTWIPQQEVLGWARHDVGGPVSALAVTRGESGRESVWLMVDRGERFYVESLDPQGDIYLDAHVVAEGDPLELELPQDAELDEISFVSGPRVLDEFAVVVEDAEEPEYEGQRFVTLSEEPSDPGDPEQGSPAEDEDELIAGIRYDMIVQPMPLLVGGPQGVVASVSQISLFILDSVGGGQVRVGELPWETAYFPEGEQTQASTFSGESRIDYSTGAIREVLVDMRSQSVGPFTLCGIGLRGERSR